MAAPLPTLSGTEFFQKVLGKLLVPPSILKATERLPSCPTGPGSPQQLPPYWSLRRSLQQEALAKRPVKNGLISKPRKYGCLCRSERGIGKPFFLCCLGTGQPPKHLLAASPKIRPPLSLQLNWAAKSSPHRWLTSPSLWACISPPTKAQLGGEKRLRENPHYTANKPPSSPPKNVYLNAKLSGLPRFSSFTQHFIFKPRNPHGVSRGHGVGGLQQNGTHDRFLLSLHPEQALCWAPFSTPVGKGLTHRSPREAAGPFFLPSAPPPPLPSASLLSSSVS